MLKEENCECGEEQYGRFTYDRGKRKGEEWWSYIYRDFDRELFVCVRRDLGECRMACYEWISARALRRAKQYERDPEILGLYNEITWRKYEARNNKKEVPPGNYVLDERE